MCWLEHFGGDLVQSVPVIINPPLKGNSGSGVIQLSIFRFQFFTIYSFLFWPQRQFEIQDLNSDSDSDSD